MIEKTLELLDRDPGEPVAPTTHFFDGELVWRDSLREPG